MMARLDRAGEGRGHGGRIGGARNGGVEQHGVKAEFHDRCRMRRPADAGVDDQRHVGKMLRAWLRKAGRVLIGPMALPIGAHQGISTLQPASSSRSATTRSSVV